MLPLLVFLSISFSQEMSKDKNYEERYVKVLYKDGRVEVVDTTKIPLSEFQKREDIIYIEKPIKLKLLDKKK
ncbi:hypothetical protein [Thermocrinis sp.]